MRRYPTQYSQSNLGFFDIKNLNLTKNGGGTEYSFPQLPHATGLCAILKCFLFRFRGALL